MWMCAVSAQFLWCCYIPQISLYHIWGSSTSSRWLLIVCRPVTFQFTNFQNLGCCASTLRFVGWHATYVCTYKPRHHACQIYKLNAAIDCPVILAMNAFPVSASLSIATSAPNHALAEWHTCFLLGHRWNSQIWNSHEHISHDWREWFTTVDLYSLLNFIVDLGNTSSWY
jgi:hypothetical protein